MCALVRAPGDGVLEAVEAQSREVDELVLDPSAALHSQATWLWLVEGRVVPDRDALAGLLEMLERWEGLLSPALLASKVVDRHGAPDRASLPVPRVVDDQDLTVAAFERNAFPVRIARAGSLLVHGRATEAVGLPPQGQDLLWTARLLKDRLGLFVPTSLAVRAGGGDGLELMPWLKLLLSGALRAGEKPLFAFRLAEAVLERLRRGR